MFDLNTLAGSQSGWVVTSANGINDLGEIAATGRDGAGSTHAVVLMVKGDFNRDGLVNDADYTVWADYFGKNPQTNGHLEYQQGKDATGGYNDADYTRIGPTTIRAARLPFPSPLP